MTDLCTCDAQLQPHDPIRCVCPYGHTWIKHYASEYGLMWGTNLLINVDCGECGKSPIDVLLDMRVVHVAG